MRTAIEITLTDEDRMQLEKLSRSKRASVRLVERSRIVLLAAQGKQDIEIAGDLGISRQKSARWRKRFSEQGLSGIEKDAPRSGRIPKISSRKKSEIIRKTTTQTPPGATHWSTRSMAKASGVSAATVGRIWRANGLKPHLIKTFKVSNDPKFEEKLVDVVGLYINPPEHALVYSVDEKSVSFRQWCMN